MYLLFISWVFDQYTLSYSTLKSFVFGRFFKNILPGKLKWESYLPIFAVLNMLKPAQDKRNRTGHFPKMATQYNMNTYQKQWAIPGKIQAKQGTWVGETWNFQGYWRTWKFQGLIKKEVEFTQECSRKSHVEWLCSNQKNVWLFRLF